MGELTMRQCNLCPRGCGVDRSVRTGVCGCGDTMHVARAALHMWEEPCLSGERGSGAVFVAGCPLHCIFCQNAAISGGDAGRAYTPEELAAEMLRLQGEGAANINLVTAGQWATAVHETLWIARAGMPGCGTAETERLRIPVVWNSSGYETEETLTLLRDDIDIYLPDLKYWAKIPEYLSSPHEYTVRFGIGMLMAHFLDEDFKKEAPELVYKVDRSEYYVRMMKAWYFATALAKQYDAALPYYERGFGDEEVKRMTKRKCLDSCRISEERK